MSMDAAHLGEGPLSDERADFILDPREVEMGAEAVASYLASLKEGDGRRKRRSGRRRESRVERHGGFARVRLPLGYPRERTKAT